MAKIVKSFKIRTMRQMKFFLIGIFLLAGCQNEEADLEIAYPVGDEFDISHLAGDPLPCPHEFLIQESPDIE